MCLDLGEPFEEANCYTVEVRGLRSWSPVRFNRLILQYVPMASLPMVKRFFKRLQYMAAIISNISSAREATVWPPEFTNKYMLVGSYLRAIYKLSVEIYFTHSIFSLLRRLSGCS